MWKITESSDVTFLSDEAKPLECDACHDKSLEHDSWAYFSAETARVLCEPCHRNSGKELECLHERDAMSSNKNAATIEDSLLFYRPGVERQIAAQENQGEVTSNKDHAKEKSQNYTKVLTFH